MTDLTIFFRYSFSCESQNRKNRNLNKNPSFENLKNKYVSARKIEKIDKISFMVGESKPKTDFSGLIFNKIVRPIYRNRKKGPLESNYTSFFFSMQKPGKVKMKLEQPYFTDYVKKISHSRSLPCVGLTSVIC